MRFILVLLLAVLTALRADAQLRLADVAGTTLRTLRGSGNAGLNRAPWDLLLQNRSETPAGEYLVTIQIGDKRESQRARVVERVR